MKKDSRVKFGFILPFAGLEPTLKLAVSAERNGFDSIWVSDHAVGISSRDVLDQWSVLPLIVERTRKAFIGTCVTDPHRKHPAVLAQEAITLQHMSKGRFILGIGAGEGMSLTPYGIDWSKPVSRLEEAIVVMKKLWTEDFVNYEGQFYKLKGAYLGLKVKDMPSPPIWIGGTQTRMRRITGSLADGSVPYSLTPEGYREYWSTVVNAAKETGRDPRTVTAGLWIPCSLAKDRETALKNVGFIGQILLTFSTFILEKEGYSELAAKHLGLANWYYTPELEKQLYENAKKVPLELVEKYYLFGTPQVVEEKIKQYIDAGVQHFVLDVFGPSGDEKTRVASILNTQKLFAKTIMSRLQRYR